MVHRSWAIVFVPKFSDLREAQLLDANYPFENFVLTLKITTNSSFKSPNYDTNFLLNFCSNFCFQPLDLCL
jgi:hypothetical protein